MPIRRTRNVSLTPGLEGFVDGRVASGRYRSASEVVRAALRLLEEDERRRAAVGAPPAGGPGGGAAPGAHGLPHPPGPHAQGPHRQGPGVQGGEMAARLRAKDWSATPLGPQEAWPQSLRTAVDLVLASPLAMIVLWGPELTQIYNDAYAGMAAAKHPAALGRPARACWPEVWHFYAPIYEAVLRGEARSFEAQRLTILRHGAPEDAWFDLAFSPLRDEGGRVGGVLAAVVDVTGRVTAEARLRFRLDLEGRLRPLRDPGDILGAASEALGRHLGAGQVAYADIDGDGGGGATVERDWSDGTVPSGVGRHRAADFGPAFVAELRRGGTIAAADARLDPRTSEPAALDAFGRMRVAALIHVPLVKAGRLVGLLAVHSAAPRAWRPEEVALAEEVAERTWAAVERARAEAALAGSEARLRLAQEAAEMGVFERDLVAGRSHWSAAMFRLYGLDPTRHGPVFSDEEHLALLLPEDRERHRARRNAARDDLGAARFAHEFRIRRADTGEVRWLSSRGEFERDAAGRPVLARGVHHDITARREAEAALRESEERLRLAVAAARIGVWTWRAAPGEGEEERVFWDARTCEILGWPAERPPRRRAEYRAFYHPGDLPRLDAAAARSVEAGEPYDQEFRAIRPRDGATVWVRVLAEAERDEAGGRVRGFNGVILDVDEAHAAAERQTLLAREVDHRAKNALAVVQATLRLTRAEEVGAYARAVEGRVRALARAHTLLAEDRWAGADLRGLLEGELAPFLGAGGGRRPPPVALDGPRVVLPAGAAQPLAMAVHELATNAAKHGALSAPGGRVLVSWRIEGAAAAAALLRLRWAEAGGPPLSGPPARRGFGSRVLDGTVRGQLGGAVSLDWAPTGLDCVLEVPLGRRGAAAAVAGGAPAAAAAVG